MRMIEANGIALHVREDGDPDGKPVVFSNSLGTDLRLWEPILPLLPAGLRIIRYDKRGHGLSDCPEGPYALEDLVADQLASYKRLSALHVVDEIPRLASGKVLRRVLRERFGPAQSG